MEKDRIRLKLIRNCYNFLILL